MPIPFLGLFRLALVVSKPGSPVSASINIGPAVRALGHVFIGIKERGTINRKIAIVLYGWVMRNFDEEGALQTPTWVPLKESTRLRKAQQGYPSAPLVRTGNLKKSYAPFSDTNVAGVGVRASFGVDYARVHEDGGGHVPKRSMLPPKEFAREKAIDIYGLEVKRLRKEAGI